MEARWSNLCVVRYMYMYVRCGIYILYLCQWDIKKGLAYNIVEMLGILQVALSLTAELQVVPLKCV